MTSARRRARGAASDGRGRSTAVSKGGAQHAGARTRSELARRCPPTRSVFLSFNGLGRTLERCGRARAADPAARRGRAAPADRPARALFAGRGRALRPPGVAVPRGHARAPGRRRRRRRCATLDRLAQRSARCSARPRVEPVPVAGVQAKQINLGSFALYYAVFDGKLVVTTRRRASAGCSDSGQKLADAGVVQGREGRRGHARQDRRLPLRRPAARVPLVENFAQARRLGRPAGRLAEPRAARHAAALRRGRTAT